MYDTEVVNRARELAKGTKLTLKEITSTLREELGLETLAPSTVYKWIKDIPRETGLGYDLEVKERARELVKKTELTYREIGDTLREEFGLDKAPNPGTISEWASDITKQTRKYSVNFMYVREENRSGIENKAEYVRNHLEVPNSELARRICETEFYVACVKEATVNPEFKRGAGANRAWREYDRESRVQEESR